MKLITRDFAKISHLLDSFSLENDIYDQLHSPNFINHESIAFTPDSDKKSLNIVAYNNHGYCYFSYDKQEMLLFFEAIYVQLNHQGTGIGNALVNAVLNYLESNKVKVTHVEADVTSDGGDAMLQKIKSFAESRLCCT